MTSCLVSQVSLKFSSTLHRIKLRAQLAVKSYQCDLCRKLQLCIIKLLSTKYLSNYLSDKVSLNYNSCTASESLVSHSELRHKSIGLGRSIKSDLSFNRFGDSVCDC